MINTYKTSEIRKIILDDKDLDMVNKLKEKKMKINKEIELEKQFIDEDNKVLTYFV